ncbi:hypothetical protein [Pseudomonas folii]|uniref:Lipoprotein n=1 Tax=Pseudomonas folii TaxID=2762593 RepID=A0ABR7AU41_9PSED|nr:hypothetical protein [Pseudomonas folii]MBC3948438.1 hypothetical protein [Pseudomonas folii]
MWLKPVALAIMLLLLVTACFAKPFQPPTDEVELWKKPGEDERQVLSSMLACGSTNRYGIDPKATLEQKAERFECMKRAGYTRSDGFDLCALDTRHELKACASAR